MQIDPSAFFDAFILPLAVEGSLEGRERVVSISVEYCFEAPASYDSLPVSTSASVGLWDIIRCPGSPDISFIPSCALIFHFPGPDSGSSKPAAATVSSMSSMVTISIGLATADVPLRNPMYSACSSGSFSSLDTFVLVPVISPEMTPRPSSIIARAL